MAAFVALSAFADDTNVNATLSYRKLDDFFQMVDGVNRSNLLLEMFVHSTNRMVQATNITLTIHSSGGNIPVSHDEHGNILNWPQSKEMARENPPIISNQPKGSLNLIITYRIPLTNDLAFGYAHLGDGVAEMNKLIKAQAGWTLSWLAPKVDTVVFFFSKTNADKAKVTIASPTGRKEYVADKYGQVKLKLDESLLSEKPQVQLSDKPMAVAPDVEF